MDELERDVVLLLDPICVKAGRTASSDRTFPLDVDFVHLVIAQSGNDGLLVESIQIGERCLLSPDRPMPVYAFTSSSSRLSFGDSLISRGEHLIVTVRNTTDSPIYVRLCALGKLCGEIPDGVDHVVI